jgi:YfiH family protein
MITGIRPNWPAPTWVNAFTTTREGGYTSHDPQHRLLLKQYFNLPYDLPWLKQTHSNLAYYVDETTKIAGEADATWTDRPGLACVISTGDCLPVLICDTKGTVVGAAHGGWRGLLSGIIENTVQGMRQKAQGDLIAWMGPAIGPQRFEVGPDVVEPFIEADPLARGAFIRAEQNGKWLANIYELARLRLNKVGITNVYGGEYCTYTDQARFYSYRLNKTKLRMASLIWLQRDL